MVIQDVPNTSPPSATDASKQHHVHDSSVKLTCSASLHLDKLLEYKVLSQRAIVKRLRRDHGSETLGTCTVNQAYGGMRFATNMTYETSDVNPYTGVRIRDIPLVDVHKRLPCPPRQHHPYTEAMLWLLLTSDVPSLAQVESLRVTLLNLMKNIRPEAFRVVDAMAADTHPMTMLSCGLLALQNGSSQLRATQNKDVPRGDLWRCTLHDVLSVIAHQIVLAAYIYRTRCSSHDVDGDTVAATTVKVTPGWEPQNDLVDNLDIAANYAVMMGFPVDDTVTHDLFRLHLTTHMDHGGGSASCLGVRVVGSTLSDAYRAWSAGINGLAGPLHGLANEDVMGFLAELQSFLDHRDATPALLKEFVWKTLDAGKVIPGYGHTTLLFTDPRFFMQREFARRHMPDDTLCNLVQQLYLVVPDILKAHGKVRNPHPNVDAHSGALLYNRGITSVKFHTVMFATSRVMGPLSNLVWDRALCLPIVRPMSVTTNFIKAKFENDPDYIPPGLPEL